MSDSVMQRYIGQLLGNHSDSEVTLAWQAGEPTLMGIDFFRRAVDAAMRLARPNQTVKHTIQTNGTLINEEWARFFKEYDFLVGVGIDGPPELHNRFRIGKKGRDSLSRVMNGLSYLMEYGVEYDILCTVNAANQDFPREVYRFLRDDCGARHVQFIPVVEPPSQPDGSILSVDSVQWGHFLLEVFDEWVRSDVGVVFV